MSFTILSFSVTADYAGRGSPELSLKQPANACQYDMPLDDDTIAAIATPIGQAGIGIIRISGPRSGEIAERIFRPKNPIQGLQSHRLYLGHLYHPEHRGVIDEVLLSFMRAPHSYTREDVVEINSHSGHILLSKILQIVIEQGARLARPGEFTLRAFLNGRIDLTQAESVMDLINSRSARGLHLAAQQTQGTLRCEIERLRQRVVLLLAQVELAIDFPEEEVDFLSREEITRRIEAETITPIEALIAASNTRRMWVEGINTVIVGRTNAGKSSLLNRFLDEQRAIVTPMPGTTRDIIESFITIEGIPLQLMDTAGFRPAKNEAERVGQIMTEQRLGEADLLLVVIDQSRRLNQNDMHIISQAKGKRALFVINKIDLPPRLSQKTIHKALSPSSCSWISALTGEGIDNLKKAIAKCILDGDSDFATSSSAPNLRHRTALMASEQFFKNAARNAKQGAPMEIIALELKSGLDALGEIIGETTTEEVLDSIFSQFCLGK